MGRAASARQTSSRVITPRVTNAQAAQCGPGEGPSNASPSAFAWNLRRAPQPVFDPERGEGLRIRPARGPEPFPLLKGA